jgi:hypothetical protein
MQHKESIALQNCNSIDDVVSLINRGGSREHHPFQIAALYAYTHAEDKKCLNQMVWHLALLAGHGARFDTKQVVQCIETNFFKGEQ